MSRTSGGDGFENLPGWVTDQASDELPNGTGDELAERAGAIWAEFGRQHEEG